MDQETEGIVRKVQKLLRMADNQKSHSENEAILAMEMANKLMTQYNLSMSDVQVKELKVEGAKDETAQIRKQCVPWERTLGSAVAALFGTRTYRSSSYEGYAMRFVGLGDDAAISAASYEILHETLTQMGKESPYRGSDQQTYRLGIANRLLDRCRTLKEKQEATIAKEAVCKDLVLVKQVAINEYCEQKLQLTNCRRGRVGGSQGSYHAGYSDGRDVGLPGKNQLK